MKSLIVFGESVLKSWSRSTAETVSDSVSVPPSSIGSLFSELGGRVSWTWRPAIWDSEGERIVATVPRCSGA